MARRPRLRALDRLTSVVRPATGAQAPSVPSDGPAEQSATTTAADTPTAEIGTPTADAETPVADAETPVAGADRIDAETAQEPAADPAAAELGVGTVDDEATDAPETSEATEDADGARDRETPLDIPRTWVEFTDPAEPRQRFRCDLTWLTSSYRCIFGAGCLGIDQRLPEAGCCTLGAHFSDADDVARVREAVAALTPEDWQLMPTLADVEDWLEEVDGEEDEEPELKTRVVDGACVLLNRSDHPGGAGCALHQAAVRDGVEPHTRKPDVCWQLPLRRTYRTVTLPDEEEYLEISIGEYDRRGWGPGGHDLDWYCTGSPLAHAGTEPLYLTSAPELRELMGDVAYAELARRCEAHLALARAAAAADAAARPGPGRRPLLPLLVHPATRLAHPEASTPLFEAPEPTTAPTPAKPNSAPAPSVEALGTAETDNGAGAPGDVDAETPTEPLSVQPEAAAAGTSARAAQRIRGLRPEFPPRARPARPRREPRISPRPRPGRHPRDDRFGEDPQPRP